MIKGKILSILLCLTVFGNLVRAGTVYTPMVEDLDSNNYDIYNVDNLICNIIETEDIIATGPWIDVRAFGALGDGVTDDTAAFNDALTVLAAGEGGTLRVPPGRYVLNEFLTRVNTTLKLDNGAIIVPPYNFSGSIINLAKGSRIEGGTIDTSDRNFTGKCIRVMDVAGAVPGYKASTEISDVTLSGDCDAPAGVGILLQTRYTSSSIVRLWVNDILIMGYGAAVQLQGDGGAGAWINANFFNNIWINNCPKGIWLNHMTGAMIDGNHFNEIIYQWQPNSIRAFYINGRFNQFNNVCIWDYPTGSTAVEIRSTSEDILINGALGPRNNIVDDGKRSRITNISDVGDIPYSGISREFTLNFGSIPAHSTAEMHFYYDLAGAENFTMVATPKEGLADGIVWNVYKHSLGATIRLGNITGGVIDPDGDGLTWKIAVLRANYNL